MPHNAPMLKRLSWVGLLAALAIAPGCQKGEGQPCFNRSDCGEGFACVGEGLMRCEKCEGQDQCKIDGQCTPKDGACVAANDQECAKSYGCKARGPCTAKDGKCVVGSDADCKQSEACAKEKFCVAKGNNCVRSEADKKAMEQAKKDAAEAAKKKQEEQEAKDAKKEKEQ